MLLDIPLRMQGIVKGDTLTLLVRHATIHDPYDVQRFVAYREEFTIQIFFVALLETSSIPTSSEIIIRHKGLCVDPPTGFKTATYRMSLPSMYASAVTRTPIRATNLSSPSQQEKPMTQRWTQRTPSHQRTGAGEPSQRHVTRGQPRAKWEWPSR